MSDLIKKIRQEKYESISVGELQQAADLIEQQQARIAELEQREAELAVTVEQIRRAYLKAGVDIQMLFELQPLQPDNSYIVDGQDCTELNRVINQTPATNLTAVKRGVAREAYSDGLADAGMTVDIDESGLHYAAQRYPDKE